MNERIRKLAKQAGWGATSDPYIRQAFDVNMFAELIVLECAAYVKNSNCFTYASQSDLCAERLKERFGVK